MSSEEIEKSAQNDKTCGRLYRLISLAISVTVHSNDDDNFNAAL